MYAVMWSEHCSYKSSRVHLKRLPTEAPHVIVGPGENAGVIDAGGGLAIALRIESHNHPSAVEPYQGAATGVGGILRDIFTMGARPIALMDPLRFGHLSDHRSRWIATGVISGISGYGNSVGVPTVGGEIAFDDCYADNPLVNVLCCGVLPIDRLVLGQASGEGNLAVLLGSATGRDGIGGVSVLASAGFSDDTEAEAAKRPNVQVGDPFEEKRLIEACLQLLDESLVTGIQDLGGAGLTCATSETASRGGVGMDVDVSAVPRREPEMEPWEVMTSESQERMLAIVTPDTLDRVLAVCERWEVRATVVGRVTASGRLRIMDGWDGPILADVPATSLHEDAPVYARPMAPPADLEARRADDPARLPAPADCGPDLLALLSDPSWVYRQYDHQLFLNTVVEPGGDAVLLRLAGPGVPAPADGGRRGPGPVDRRQCPLVLARSPARHVAGGRRVDAQCGLRGCSSGRPRQLLQLRQPGAPRSDVAVLRGDRRHGRSVPGARSASHRRQREPLQREPRARHRSHSHRGHAGTGRTIGPPAPGRRLGRGERRFFWPGRRHGRWPGRAGRWSCTATGAGRCRRWTWRGTGGWWRWWRRWSRTPSSTAFTTCLMGAWGWRWPRWRSVAGSGAGWAAWSTTPPCSGRARRGSCSACPVVRWPSVTGRLDAAGIEWVRLGAAGGDRLVVDGLVDVAVAAAVSAWRGALPSALGVEGSGAGGG